MKKITYLFAAMGPGETSQAISLSKYISQKGNKILFCINKKKNAPFLKKHKNFKMFLLNKPEELADIIKKEKPQVFVLCNSKIWNRHKTFSKSPPFQKPKVTVSIDSNWLFNVKDYPQFVFAEWADKYLIVFPEKIFNLGLKKNKGDFKIPAPILKKTIPVGFIPFYKKPGRKTKTKIRKQYKIRKNEKLIFAYFSGFGAGHRIFAFNNLIDSVEKIIKKGKKIKILYIGPTEKLNKERLKKKWLIAKQCLSSEQYFLTLASADLVFQHQGMVTLSQAISAKVPVICNIKLFPENFLPKLHFWEVGPFDKIGACKMFAKSTSMKEITAGIEQLLFNKKAIKKMKKAQKTISQAGEKKAFNIIKKLIKQKL